MLWLFIGTDRINLAKIEGVRLEAAGSKKIEITTGTDVFRYAKDSTEGRAVAWFFGAASDFAGVLHEFVSEDFAALDLARFKALYDRKIAEHEAREAKASVEANIFPHPDDEDDDSGRAA